MFRLRRIPDELVQTAELLDMHLVYVRDPEMRRFHIAAYDQNGTLLGMASDFQGAEKMLEELGLGRSS